MAVETQGRLQLPEAEGPGVPVLIVAKERRLVVLQGEEVVGDWHADQIGIHALDDRFVIKVGGEELILKAEKDAELAVELGIVAASPRLARRMAALHNPEEPQPVPLEVEEEMKEESSRLGPIAYALGAVLVLVGGALVRAISLSDPFQQSRTALWPLFVGGGLVMMLVAILLVWRRRSARFLAYLVLAGVLAGLALVASDVVTDPGHLTAYGFVAAGLVVGVAALVWGDTGRLD